MSPSTPTEPCNSNKEAANAFAATHPNKPDLICHACSARFLVSAVSLLARALAPFRNLLQPNMQRASEEASQEPGNSVHQTSPLVNAVVKFTSSNNLSCSVVVCCCVLLCVVECCCVSCWWCGCWFAFRRTPLRRTPKISLFFFPLSRHHFSPHCVFVEFWWFLAAGASHNNTIVENTFARRTWRQPLL